MNAHEQFRLLSHPRVSRHGLAAFRRRLRESAPRQESGMILIVAAWSMIIMSILAVSLSRRLSAEISLTKHFSAQWRIEKAVWQGLREILIIIDEDVKDRKAGGPGTDLTDRPEYKKVQLKDGSFDVYYRDHSASGASHRQYGIALEERKININTLPVNEYATLVYLLEELGVAKNRAQIITASILDWRDTDSDVFNKPFGAEDDFYMNLSRPYHCKNQAFESVEELLLVRAVDAAIFEKLRPFITVYPVEGPFRVDMKTASCTVLKSLARNFTGPRTNVDLSDADSLAEKICSRRSRQGLDEEGLGLNSRERVLFTAMKAYQTTISETFSFIVEARDKRSGFVTAVEIVVFEPQLRVLYWQRL